MVDHRRSQEEIRQKLEELYTAQTELSKDSDDIARTALHLISAKIYMLEWVLHINSAVN